MEHIRREALGVRVNAEVELKLVEEFLDVMGIQVAEGVAALGT